MLYKKITLLFFLFSFGTGCQDSDDETVANESVDISETPTVKAESTYYVWLDEDITYAEGLSFNESSTTSFATPLKLDVYFPDNETLDRPVFMFIHGGGFVGGTKTKPEIVEMANYYASRGWVFVSIDYRTAEELITITGM